MIACYGTEGRPERAGESGGAAASARASQQRHLRAQGPEPDWRQELLAAAAAGDEYAQWRVEGLYEH